MCDRQGTLLHITALRAPWQNGRTARHSALMKKIVARPCFHHSPLNLKNWRLLDSECNAAKSRRSNQARYSPLHCVFGATVRLLGELTPDDPYVPDALYDFATSDPSFEEAVRGWAAGEEPTMEVTFRHSAIELGESLFVGRNGMTNGQRAGVVEIQR